MSIVGSLVGGILGSGAANDAASVESKAAQQAQQLEKTNQNSALTAQDTALSNITAAQQPYQALGSTAANNLSGLLSTGFTAPTLEQARNTPGYQFTLEQGTRAIDQNAAANGTLLSGNTGAALERYGQGLADTTYGDVYNRAMQGYMANLQGLMGGSQLGLSSTGQLTGANLTTAGNKANIDLRSSEDQASQINNAAAARASGYLGSANAWSTAAGGMAGGLQSGFGNMSKDSSGWENVGNFALGALAI